MAIKTSSGGNFKKDSVNLKINLKTGAFVASQKNEAGDWEDQVLPPMTDASGYLTFMDLESGEYEGKARQTLVMGLSDPNPDEPNVFIRMTVSSGDNPTREGLKMLGALNGANLMEPVVLRPWFLKAGHEFADGKKSTKDNAGVTLKQGDKKVAPDFGLDENGVKIEKIPFLEPVKDASGQPMIINGAPIIDKTPHRILFNNVLNAFAEKHNGMADAIKQHVRDVAAGNTPQAEDDEGMDIAEAAAAAAAAEQQSIDRPKG